MVELGVVGTSGAISELSFEPGDTAIGKIVNHGTATSKPLALSLTGDGAADFTIDPASSCAGRALAPDDSCMVTVQYVPTVEALRTATLIIDAGAAVQVQVALRPPPRPRLVIRFAGSGVGEVRVSNPLTGEALTTCTRRCSLAIDPGTQVEITAATPSIYRGLSGACSSTTPSCDLTIGSGTTIVTATFATDPKEIWTRLPGGAPIVSAAFDGSGNLVAASNGITKLSPTGAELWRIPLGACAVATGPGDTIYAETATTINKLAPDGATIWSRPLDPLAKGCGDTFSGFVHNVAVGSDGAVAVHGDLGVARWDGDGNLRWAIAVDSLGEFGVAIEPDGVVDVAVLTDEPIDVLQYGVDGAFLGRIEHITSQYHGMFVVDSLGRLLSAASGHSHTDAFGHTVDLRNDPDFAPTGICSVGTDDVAWLYLHDDSLFTFAHDWTVNRYHADGSLAWTYSGVVSSASFFDGFGTIPLDIAGSRDGRIAIVGSFAGPTYNGGWIAMFSP